MKKFKARKVQQKRYANQREDRRKVIDDLLRREQEYLDKMMNKRMQKAKEKEQEEEEKKESEIDVMIRETKAKERMEDLESFEQEQKLKKQRRKREQQTKTIIRMKWDKKKVEYSQGLISIIFEGFCSYTPHVVMDSKPGKAFIEFLDLQSAKIAYEEISEEKNDFKLKLMTTEKVKLKRKEFSKAIDVDDILKEAGITITNRDLEFENLGSLEEMEEVLLKKINDKLVK
mmetsp:Transcript_24659/g.21888  ORF Transcript_24659/g.21888 Transcript_24659/m.21888 type:complete len:230 (+) Transcript_24659:63-752(+)